MLDFHEVFGVRAFCESFVDLEKKKKKLEIE
jgi:hypothetical protein